MNAKRTVDVCLANNTFREKTILQKSRIDNFWSWSKYFPVTTVVLVLIKMLKLRWRKRLQPQLPYEYKNYKKILLQKCYYTVQRSNEQSHRYFIVIRRIILNSAFSISFTRCFLSGKKIFSTVLNYKIISGTYLWCRV